jgi:phosphoenolpyruvate-protein phosphotransferase
MPNLQILAPFDGWLSPLDEVPDPVFAQRMLGDGLAIDPTSGILLAPCAGEIVALPASAHAVSIRTAQGIDVLIHVGIDTVRLGGRGFEARVLPGAVVRAGEELLRVDLDIVARGAKSLMTPIVVTPLDGLGLRRQRAGGPVFAGDLLFEVVAAADAETAAGACGAASGATVDAETATSAYNVASGDASTVHSLIVPLRHGLHARPAALLAQRAKSRRAQVTLCAHGRSANARSVVAIMALGARHGDELTIRAVGADAAQSVAGLLSGIDEALRMEDHDAPPPTAMPAVASTVPADGVFRGAIAVGGFAVGRAARIERREIAVIENGSGAAHEAAELAQARAQTHARLTRLTETGGAARRAIIAAHLEFLDDPEMNEAANALIAAGKSAAFAWRAAIRRSIAALESLGDARLRERADDLLDVEAHVLLALAGEARPMIIPLPEQAVLLAEDLLPSELTALDRQRLLAIGLAGGGATSHVAILAAAMEIPMLVGLGAGIHEIAAGAAVIVDADGGTLQSVPTASAIEAAHAALDARRRLRAIAQAEAQGECRALDGTRVEVFANLGNVADAAAAVANGAEGCGLLRTEFLFLDRETAPDEAEQLAAYQEIAAALAPRPLILRLMDVGGDKPLRYLPLPAEENPALGLRGVRTALAHPDLLRTQLRAALRVQPPGGVRILIPMITDVAEITAVRAIIDELLATLGIRDGVELGAMIETPAAALTAPGLVREVDFLSIGSNDLTQYTLAMDRGHAQLAARTDALHPAVLRLIAATASAGVAAGKCVAVCGGMAADRLAVPLLLGLGVRELSVVPAAVPDLKRQIRSLRIDACRELAMRCLDLASPAAVRAWVTQTIDRWGEVR